MGPLVIKVQILFCFSKIISSQWTLCINQDLLKGAGELSVDVSLKRTVNSIQRIRLLLKSP